MTPKFTIHQTLRTIADAAEMHECSMLELLLEMPGDVEDKWKWIELMAAQ